jgi:Right handed beta helix region
MDFKILLKLYALAILILTGCKSKNANKQGHSPTNNSETVNSVSVALNKRVVSEVYVSTKGNDINGLGTLETPYATLGRAQQAVREILKTKEVKGNITVWIIGGDYEQTKALEFTDSDSGVGNQEIIYRAVKGETPRIYGGIKITQWKKLNGGIFQAKLPEAVTANQMPILLENKKMSQVARFPNTGYLKTNSGRDRNIVVAEKNDLPKDPFGPNSQVSIWAGHDWFSNLLTVKKFNFESSEIELESTTSQNISKENRYFIQGAFSNIDQPGEYSIDHKGRSLFYFPRTNEIEKQDIFISTTPVIVNFIGSAAGAPVKNIRFEGIHFLGGSFTRNFREQDKTWNQPAPQNRLGLITMENASQISIVGNQISGGGFSGVSLKNSTQNINISLNHIHDLGYHGVLAVGADVGEVASDGKQIFDNKGHTIYGNHIHHTGKIIGHGAGIFLFQSGKNTISRNKIHNIPRYAIGLKGSPQLEGMIGKTYGNTLVTEENFHEFHTGRYNTISNNEIFSVVEDSDDAGAITAWGGGRGNVAKNNLIYNLFFDVNHGIGQAFYLDDGANDWTLDENVIHTLKGNRTQGIFAKGVETKIFRNIISLDSPKQFGIRSQEFAGVRTDKHTYRKNVIVFRKEGGPVFDFPNFGPTRVAESNENIFYAVKDKNLTVRIDAKEISMDEWKKLNNAGLDSNSKIVDPKFENISENKLSFGKDSPLFALGIQSPSAYQVGLPPEYTFSRD